jgi:SAM-dependent methyltransferase
MKETDIRPKDLFADYMEKGRADAALFNTFQNRMIPCPACESSRARYEFNKWGFDYVSCLDCGSLYQAPRPPEAVFFEFYARSPFIRYWVDTVFPRIAESRRIQLFRPKVNEIAELCADAGFEARAVGDVGAGYGIFLEEWRSRFPKDRVVAIEPNARQADICRSKQIDVYQCMAEEMVDLEDSLDLLVCFEVLDHVPNPDRFCRSLKRLLRPGGRLLMTALSIDGFDIQVLWKESKSIFPPHHINFFSVQGFERLMKRSGFSESRVFTPGKLDVDIVRNAGLENGALLSGQRFIEKLIHSDELARQQFQSFLREHKMSSHCWVWALK